MSNMAAVKPVILSLHYKPVLGCGSKSENSAIHFMPGNKIGLMAENSTQWGENYRN